MNPTHEAMIRKLIEKTLSHQYKWRKAIKADSEIIKKLKTKEPTADMSKSYILEQDKQKFVILADSNRTIFYLLIINENFNEPLFTSTSSLYQLYTIVEGMVRSEMSSLDLYLENLIDND